MIPGDMHENISSSAGSSFGAPSARAADIIWKHPAHAMALGLGSGLMPAAPGTIATLWAWLIFLVIDPIMSDWAWAITLCAGFILGMKACTITGKALGRVDASCIVWDEVIAFWFVLWCLPRLSDPAGFHTLGDMPEWLMQLVAFGLFRFFDVAKPAPIGRIDRMSKDGVGVMADDMVAAFYTLLVCAVMLRFVHLVQGWF